MAVKADVTALLEVDSHRLILCESSWNIKGEEGKTTSATLGSLEHRWQHAGSRAGTI
jgi:hypothetical protein